LFEEGRESGKESEFNWGTFVCIYGNITVNLLIELIYANKNGKNKNK
jgi:hypothetical protein